MATTYNITFSKNKGELNFETVASFIEWAFSDKKAIEKGKFNFKSEINDIDIDDVKNILPFLKYYIKVKKLCDKKMNSYNDSLRKLHSNNELQRAFDEFIRVNANGKFLRAMLTALGYQSTNKKDNKYIDLALALEVFQTSILIHDDIIDNAVVRRGKDTIPVSYNKSFKTKKSDDFIQKRNKFSDSMAICIGDLGFYLAEELIVKNYKNNSNLSDILSYYHQTAIKTCMGEMIDITLPFKEEFYKTDPNLEEKITEVYKLKTAWYSVVGPYCLGLTLGGASKKQVKSMEEVLLGLGIAFQIKDDLLGIYGDEKHLGKSTNSDIEEYKQTILYSYTIKTKYKNQLLKYYGKHNLTKEEINKVKEIFEVSGAKKYAEDIMDNLFKTSLLKIKKDKYLNDEHKNLLIGFIIYLENRSK